MKAAYFEAILGSVARSRVGHGLPLVAYEAHRFLTSDAAHGEQSFMDACRSFGAYCVLATQLTSLGVSLSGRLRLARNPS